MASLPIKVAQLKFGYDQTEDRLILLATNAEGQTIVLHLARRLTGRAVNAFAKILEASSAVAQQAPSEMRDDVILLEHQVALSGQRSGPMAEPASSGSNKPTAQKLAVAAPLVHTLQITTKPSAFELVLNGEDHALAALTASRKDLHRILETLLRIADAADWHISIVSATNAPRCRRGWFVPTAIGGRPGLPRRAGS